MLKVDLGNTTQVTFFFCTFYMKYDKLLYLSHTLLTRIKGTLKKLIKKIMLDIDTDMCEVETPQSDGGFKSKTFLV